MKANHLFLLTTACIWFSLTLFGQPKKYAILIAGDPVGTVSDDIQPENGGWPVDSTEYVDEFWNDAFLMYKMLRSFDFSPENIQLLYYNGEDFDMPDKVLDPAYDPDIQFYNEAPLTDAPAHKEDIEDAIAELPVGPDDFLFIWILSHGYVDYDDNFYFYCTDAGGETKYYDYELANDLESLPCKTVIWMSSCFAGGFIDNFEDFENTIFMSASSDSEWAHRCDQKGAKIENNTLQSWCYFDESEVRSSYYWHHGEFDYHMFSSTFGKSPFDELEYTIGMNNNNEPITEPFSDADKINDGIISIQEAYDWNVAHNSITMIECPSYGYETPQVLDEDNIAAMTSFKYPTLLCVDIEGHLNVSGIVAVSKDIHVKNGGRLHLADADVIFINDAKLYVDPGGELKFDNVTVHGSLISKIIVNGDLNIETGTIFTGDGQNGNFGGLEINNQDGQISINGASFINTRLINYRSGELNINGSMFNNCKSVSSLNGNINVTNTSFSNNSYLYISNMDHAPSSTAIVQYCNFSNSTMPALQINNYNNYSISANSIHDGAREGIALYFCGNGQTKTIANNYIYDFDRFGVMCYHSSGTLNNNHIFDNQFGIGLLNNSTYKVYGNPVASYNDQTQSISDNSWYELYADKNGFPYPFLYNIISDPDNGGNSNSDPLICWRNPQYVSVSVRDNCWGSNFNHTQDLFPSEFMTGYETVLCPPQGAISPPDPPDALFENAEEEEEEEDYYEAMESFYSIINLYPHTVAAQTALKLLFVQEYYAGNDYEGLKEYYLSNDSILADSSLREIGVFMANECDIILENWSNSINWYENRILNPNSTEDSIYAIIDLGYLYFLMVNDSLKSGATGALPQYKPESMDTFIPYRDSLLRLLPGEAKDKRKPFRKSDSKIGELLQNNPNPFATETEISFILAKQGTVSIIISDNLNRVVRTVELGFMESGNYNNSIKTNDLPPGMYFYSLYVNGSQADTKKMIKM